MTDPEFHQGEFTPLALAIPSKAAPYTLIPVTIPPVGPKDVLVKVEGVALNPVEWKVRHIYTEAFGPYPQFPGTDGAGTVVEVGAEVDRLKEGDRIAFQGWFTRERTSFQHYALVYADLAVKIPPSMPFLEASTIPLALCTAAFGLCFHSHPTETQPYDEDSRRFSKLFSGINSRGGAGLKPFWETGAEGSAKGEPIVVLGGSSSIGQFIIQIAKYMGYAYIIATSSLKHTTYLRSIGATHIIDRHLPDEGVFSQIKEILGENALHLVFDAVDSPNKQAHVDYLSPGGTFVNAMDVEEGLNLEDGRKAIGTMGNAHLYESPGVAMYWELDSFLENGIIKPTRIEELPDGLKGIPNGLDRLEKGQISGLKLVANPWKTPLKAEHN